MCVAIGELNRRGFFEFSTQRPYNGKPFSFVELKMGLPLGISRELDHEILDLEENSESRSHLPTAFLAGSVLARPQDPNVQKIYKTSDADLLRHAPGDDLSDRISGAIRYIFKPPFDGEMERAMEVLRQYVYTMENTVNDLCLNPMKTSRCVQARVCTADEKYSEILPRLLASHSADLACSLGEFLSLKGGVISEEHVGVMQLFMSGAVVPASSGRGLAVKGDREAENVYLTLADLDGYYNLTHPPEDTGAFVIETAETTHVTPIVRQEMAAAGILAAGVTKQTIVYVTHVDTTETDA